MKHNNIITRMAAAIANPIRRSAASAAVLLSIAAITACTTADSEPPTGEKQITFTVTGDFTSPTFTRSATETAEPSTFSAGCRSTAASQQATTRAALTADGKSMTDLWLFDYVNGTLVQQIHQSSTDTDFGTPSISLAYGQHQLYFVASRGKTPAVSTTNHVITWATPSDTFYKSVAVDISSGSATAQDVTLDRKSTKLSITINDALPEGISSIAITPAAWYYGIDYLTGAPASSQEAPCEFSIANTDIGATGVTLSYLGLSATTEWTTNISVTARDAEDEIIGQAAITAAPFLANRATNYAGNLFNSTSTFTVSLTTAWGAPYNGTW